MYHKSLKNKEKIFAVAPMMDWTDRHCRYFHRQLTRRTLLYTEMVVADAIIHGDRERLIDFDATEHPVALQLGGSQPEKLAEAARIAAGFGYDEINLNVGCPSDRVRSGTFGACLMREPETVGRCVSAIKAAVAVPVTVKCRIGVDDQEPLDALWTMARRVFDAGSDGVWVHARKAWLDGLSPKENRTLPPLNYPLVYRLKREYPHCFIGINGGIQTIDEAIEHLQHTDGAMLGRAAYQTPAILCEVDRLVYGVKRPPADLDEIVGTMAGYACRHIASGGRLVHITRHMTGLLHGRPGARTWRRRLSEEGARQGSGPGVLLDAWAEAALQQVEAA